MGTSSGAWHGGSGGARRYAAWVVSASVVALLGLGLWGAGQSGLLRQAVPATEDVPASGDVAAEVDSSVPVPAPPRPPAAEPEEHDSEQPASHPPDEEERRAPDPEREGERDETLPLDVAAVQRQLSELGLFVGADDGVQGQQTTAAVMAFQRVNRIEVDGVIGPQTMAALEDPRPVHVGDGAPTRIDVDLTHQLLHVIENGRRIATVHVSSGNGQRYATSSGGTAYGNTPVGTFTVERRIAGERRADLGILYDPLYFYRGWAIHGSSSVPAHPASHGCIRIARADAVWLFQRVADGTPVVVHGGQHVFVPSGGS